MEQERTPGKRRQSPPQQRAIVKEVNPQWYWESSTRTGVSQLGAHLLAPHAAFTSPPASGGQHSPRNRQAGSSGNRTGHDKNTPRTTRANTAGTTPAQTPSSDPCSSGTSPRPPRCRRPVGFHPDDQVGIRLFASSQRVTRSNAQPDSVSRSSRRTRSPDSSSPGQTWPSWPAPAGSSPQKLAVAIDNSS